MKPSTTFLRASLKLWRRRHAYRQRRLDLAHVANDAARIEHWHGLLEEAGANIARREAQLAAKLTLHEKAWREAGKCVGIREVGGNNHGARVTEIIDYAGGDHGEPWCVDGVIWCYGHAGSKVVKRGFPRAVRNMLVSGVRKVSAPKRGMPVRFIFDHVGLFGGWRRAVAGRYVACPQALATHILTREFNTGATGAVSDGNGLSADGVYEKIRARGLVADYLEVLR